MIEGFPHISLYLTLLGFWSIYDFITTFFFKGKSNKHRGNSAFRHLISKYKHAYLSARKYEKRRLSQNLVAFVQNNGGRFLEQNKEDKCWYEIGDDRAKDKVSQAIREGFPMSQIAREYLARDNKPEQHLPPQPQREQPPKGSQLLVPVPIDQQQSQQEPLRSGGFYSTAVDLKRKAVISRQDMAPFKRQKLCHGSLPLKKR